MVVHFASICALQRVRRAGGNPPGRLSSPAGLARARRVRATASPVFFPALTGFLATPESRLPPSFAAASALRPPRRHRLRRGPLGGCPAPPSPRAHLAQGRVGAHVSRYCASRWSAFL